LKLVLEIVAVVVTWILTSGSAFAGMHIYHLMIADLNRNLPEGKKIDMVFNFFDSRAVWYNVVREHRKQFPASNLYLYMRISYGIMLTWLGILFWVVVIYDHLHVAR
jgi:hypothetical protein